MDDCEPLGTAHPPEILIVEDNFLAASEMSDIVRDCGYRVAGTAARLKRGFDLLEERPVDAAIVDINLDGTYSFPLAAELERRKVPYFFLTSYPDSIVPPGFRRAPLLSKPFDREQIRSALDALVARRPPVEATTPEIETMREPDNRLLQALDPGARNALASCLQRKTLKVGDVLEEIGRPATRVTFPIDSVIALEAGKGRQRMQVALVGHEGMVGISLMLGGVAANRATVLFAGDAWQVPADIFAKLVADNRSLERQLLQGVNAFIANLSQTALANGLGTIEQRVAHWLLTVTERLDGTTLALTHDVIAQALGVRRAGVTVAMHLLEGKHAVRSVRRRLEVLSRERLAEIAGAFSPR